MSKTATPGAGFFRAGSIVMIVTGLMHASGHLAPTPPEAQVAIEGMKTFSVTLLGRTWDLHDAYETLSLSYAWMSILLGAVALLIVHRLAPEARTLRLFALVYAAGAAMLVVISTIYRVSPPIHLYALATALFGGAALRARGGAGVGEEPATPWYPDSAHESHPGARRPRALADPPLYGSRARGR